MNTLIQNALKNVIETEVKSAKENSCEVSDNRIGGEYRIRC
jgi:hypothetical protein